MAEIDRKRNLPLVHFDGDVHISMWFLSSAAEMDKWMEDIKMAIELADKCNGPSSEILGSSLTDSSKFHPFSLYACISLFCLVVAWNCTVSV